MKKRILSAVLALCMLVSLLPVNVFASEDAQTSAQTSAATETVTASIQTQTTQTPAAEQQLQPAQQSEQPAAIEQPLLQDEDLPFGTGHVDYDSATHTYTVHDETGLRWIADVTNQTIQTSTYSDDPTFALNGFLNQTILLDQDITLTTPWVPIGNNYSNHAFQGTFDGQGHTVSGLSLAQAYHYSGFFGYISIATIQNLTVSANINATLNDESDFYFGMLCGAASTAAIKNCHSTGEIDVSGSTTGNKYVYIGGLIGQAGTGTIATGFDSIITDCSVAGSIKAGGSFIQVLIAGLIGDDSCNTINSVSTADVTFNNTDSAGKVGGFCGYLGRATNCYETGNVTLTGTASKKLYYGGFAAALSAKGNNCVSLGTVKAEGFSNGASFCTLMYGALVNCYAAESSLHYLNGYPNSVTSVGFIDASGALTAKEKTTLLYGTTLVQTLNSWVITNNETIYRAWTGTGTQIAFAETYPGHTHQYDGWQENEEGSSATGTCTQTGCIQTATSEAKVTSDTQTNYFLSLDDAVAAAKNLPGSTVTLLADAESLTLDGGNYQLDGNGHTITQMYVTAATSILVKGNTLVTSLTVDQNAGIKLYQGQYDLISVASGTVEALLAENCHFYNQTDGALADATQTSASAVCVLQQPTAWGDHLSYEAATKTFTINDAQGLLWVSQVCNKTITDRTYIGDPTIPTASFDGYTIELSQDIALSGEWMPIGSTQEKPFSGVFDANNHTISNIQITDASLSNVGLFGYVVRATIKDLTLHGTITLQSQRSAYVGLLVGFAKDATIQNCNIDGDVLQDLGDNTTVFCMMGGLVGYLYYSTTEDCQVSGKVSLRSSAFSSMAGGFYGMLYYGQIKNCIGDIELEAGLVATQSGSKPSAGGFFGQSHNSDIINCYCTGKITELNLGIDDVGALGGMSWGTNYRNCYTDVQFVKAETGNNSLYGILSYCYDCVLTNCYYNAATAAEIAGYKSDSTVFQSVGTYLEDGTLTAKEKTDLIYGTTLLSALNSGVITENDTQLNTWVAGETGPVFGPTYAGHTHQYVDWKESGNTATGQCQQEDCHYVANAAAKVKNGATTTYFDNWEAAIAAAEEGTGCSVVLLADMQEMTIAKGNYSLELNDHSVKNLNVTGQSNVTICGNGYVTTMAVSSGASVQLAGGLYDSLTVADGTAETLLQTGCQFYSQTDASLVTSIGASLTNIAVLDGPSEWLTNITYDAANKIYTVSSGAGLAWVAGVCSGNLTDKTYVGDPTVPTDRTFTGCSIVLANDITLQGEWQPIGTDNIKPFSGNFDGQNHTINGLSLTKITGKYMSLFGYTKSATVKNVSLKGTISLDKVADIKNTTVVYCAPLISYMDNGSIENCSTDVPVSTNMPNKEIYFYVGGLAASMHGLSTSYCNVTNCSVAGNLTLDNKAYVGGLCASFNYTNISDCKIESDITVSDSTQSYIYLGGMGAQCSNGSISNSSFTGNITSAVPCYYVGGLLASANRINISNSHTTLNINVPSAQGIGGLLGYSLNVTAVNGYTDVSFTNSSNNTYVLIANTSNNTLKNWYWTKWQNLQPYWYIQDAVTASFDANTGTLSAYNNAVLSYGDTLSEALNSWVTTNNTSDYCVWTKDTEPTLGTRYTAHEHHYGGVGSENAQDNTAICRCAEEGCIQTSPAAAKVFDGESTKYYASLTDAVTAAAAKQKSVVTLFADADALTITEGTYTLQLNGYTAAGVNLTNTAQVTITGTGTVSSLQTESAQNAVLSGGTYGTVSIGSGTTALGGLLAPYYVFAKQTQDTSTYYDASTDQTALTDVTVRPVPVQITTDLENTSVTYGNPNGKTLSLQIQTAADFTKQDATYEWKVDDQSVSTESVYTIDDTLSGGTHTVQCLVTVDGYTVESAIATLTIDRADGSVLVKDSYSSQQNYTAASIQDPAASDITTSSTGAVTYLWYSGTLTLEQTKTAVALPQNPAEIGTYTLRVDVAQDGNYNAATVVQPITIAYLQTDAAVSLSGEKNGEWYIENVTLHAPEGYLLAANNNADAQWTQTQTVESDCNEDVTYYLKQTATGAITDAKLVRIKRDTTAPSSITASVDQVNATTANLTIQAQDAMSGIASYAYTLYSGGAQVSSEESLASAEIALSNLQHDTAYAIRLTAKDAAGNVSEVCSKNFTTTKGTLVGTPSLSPLSFAYGDTVTVKPNITTTFTGTLHYAWTAGSTAVGTDSDQYVLQSSDIGKIISCTIIAEHCSNALVATTQTPVLAARSTIRITSNVSKAYDGRPVATPTYEVNGSTAEVQLIWYEGQTMLQSAPKNAGTYSVKAVVATDGIFAGAESEPYSVTVTAKQITATASVEDKMYDGTTTAKVTLTPVGVLDADTVTLQASGTFENKNVGNKVVTIGTVTKTGTGSDNYTVLTPESGSASITAKQITATASAEDKVYDGTTTAKVTLTPVGVLDADTVTLQASGTFENKNVGNKVVTIGTVTKTGTGSDNYTVQIPQTTQAEISKATIRITGDGTVQVAKFYNGTTDAGALTGMLAFSGVVGTEDVSLSLTPQAYPQAQAGRYPVEITLSLQGEDKESYQLENDTYTLQQAIIYAVTHVEAVAPTSQITGNVEYWYCEQTNQYFADAACSQEITQADTVLARTGPTAAEQFSDVQEGRWYTAGIEQMFALGYMRGMTDTQFGIHFTLTRGQLITTLYRIAGSPESQYTGRFTDVPAGRFYSLPVEWAAANNVVSGVGANKFMPDQNITREQMATILYRYAGSPSVEEEYLSAYPDAGNVSSFAKKAMNWAIGEGLITGDKNTATGIVSINPKNSATRAQAAVILARYLG